MLKQSLHQKLLQKLSPQQIQFIKLLQVSTVALDARIKEELEENPALEDSSLMINEEIVNEYDDLKEEKIDFDSEENSISDEFNIDEYLEDNQADDYNLSFSNTNDEEESKERPIALEHTFFEDLQEQLDLVPLSDTDFVIGKQIIGSLDDDGYLRRPILSMIDDLAFSQNLFVSIDEVEEVLKVIQNFHPPGIAARDLKECLILQLKQKDQNNPIVQKAMLIVEQYLEDFTRKHYEKIEKNLNLSDEELRNIILEIKRLNPKPGDANQITTKQMQVIPDFHVVKSDEVLILTLNAKNAPELKVSKTYRDMFEHYDKSAQKDKKMKEAVQFVKQKLDAARWFIDAIKQRQQTLLKTMNAIMNYQYEYFMTGDERKIRPMILKDISDKIQMDISTVSRVANSKYVQTEFGTFLLKHFFSESIQTDDGGEVSNKEVKKILEEHISKEEKRKPLTDEQLTDILKEQGYNIARRTVAKYREQMNISVARLRKEL
ncbi:MAG: RNA polymerase factor sigma-54 [Sphingobacteriaceae bacterium]|nr:RNA polymerase factor sigma-54 [Sphingobacteriaceae bacterium]